MWSGYAAFFAWRSDADLAEIIEYTTTTGVPFATAVVDILTHVVIHGGYHRGQIAKAFGRVGVPAPQTDYILYVRSLADD